MLLNISWIIMEVKYGAIGDDYYTCHGYYIINFSSSQYILQSDLNSDGQVISSGEMVCEGTYFFQSISILIIMFYKKINTITQLYQQVQ